MTSQDIYFWKKEMSKTDKALCFLLRVGIVRIKYYFNSFC
jgi:hypothetical protein